MKLWKKMLCGVLSAAILMTALAVPAAAEDNIKVVLDGQTLSFDVPPQTVNNRTMVPLRAIFEALGANVEWNEDTQTVTASKGETLIRLTINDSAMYVNGIAVLLDAPACVVSARTLVPVRAISEAYNANVDWDENTKTVTIISQVETPSAPLPTFLAMSEPTPEPTPEPIYGTNSVFEKLKNELINKGEYSSKYNNYSIFNYDYKRNISVLISYNLKDNTISALSESKGEGLKVSIFLEIFDGELLPFMSEPMLSIASEYNGREENLLGYFSSETHQFIKMSSTFTSNSTEESALEISNTTFKLFDAILETKGINVTFSSFGISY